MNKVKTISLKMIIVFCAFITNSMFSFSEVEKLSQHLEEIVHNNKKTQPRYSSDSVMHKEYDYLIYYDYQVIYEKYNHLTVNEWRKAYDRAVHSSTLENLMKNYWNTQFKTDYSFYNSIDYHIAEFFIWLNNELNILYYNNLDNIPLSHFTLREIGQSKKNHYFASYKKNMVISTIDDKIHNKYNFELYPMNDYGKAQKEILQALHRILTCAFDYEGIDAYYREYDSAVKKNGHYSVFLWWSVFNARTENGLTIIDLPTNSWYNGGKSELQRMKYVLDIAMNEGKENITFKELLNTLESFYSIDDQYRNFVVKEMISERDHMSSFEDKI